MSMALIFATPMMKTYGMWLEFGGVFSHLWRANIREKRVLLKINK